MSMDKVFQAMASTVRRQILAYLSETQLTASDIAQRFNMSDPAISKHLSKLHDAGLVSKQREGQYVYYKLVRDNLLNQLFDTLVEFCPKGGPLKKEGKELERIRSRLTNEKAS